MGMMLQSGAMNSRHEFKWWFKVRENEIWSKDTEWSDERSYELNWSVILKWMQLKLWTQLEWCTQMKWWTLGMNSSAWKWNCSGFAHTPFLCYIHGVWD